MRLFIGIAIGLLLGSGLSAAAQSIPSGSPSSGPWYTTYRLLDDQNELTQLGYVAGAVDGLTTAQAFATRPDMRGIFLAGARCLGDMHGTLGEVRTRLISKLRGYVSEKSFMGVGGAATSILYVACQP